MNIKNIFLLFFINTTIVVEAAVVSKNTEATKAQTSAQQTPTIQQPQELSFQEKRAEIIKCNKFKDMLYGKETPLARRLSLVGAFSLGFVLQWNLTNGLKVPKLYGLFDYIPKKKYIEFYLRCGISMTNESADRNNEISSISKAFPVYVLSSLFLQYALSKSFKTNFATKMLFSANPIGVLLYATFNCFMLESNLTYYLNEYEPKDIPICIATEFTTFAEQYQSKNGVHTLSFKKRVEFGLSLLKKVDEFIHSNNKKITPKKGK
jgi:hypothetical protein